MTHQIIQTWAPTAPVQSEKTFAEAAANYIEHGGDGRFLDPIIEYFGNRPLASLFPFGVKQMAITLFPTQRNRQALTPTRAVINHGYDRGWCNLIRIKKLKEDPAKPRQPVSAVWMHAFIRQCTRDRIPHVAAIVLFMAQMGARISKAINMRWKGCRSRSSPSTARQNEDGPNSIRHLTDEMAARLRDLRGEAGDDDRVFRFANRHSVNERIRAVCRRA